MDILKEIGYSINDTEVGFFGVLLQNDPQIKKVVPTYIMMGEPTSEIKAALVKSLINLTEKVKSA